MRLALLHTNDFHGTLTPSKAAFIAQLRRKINDLYFDSGDCIKTGNLGIPLRPEIAWELLAQAGCAASVPGNRESHVLASGFRAKIEGHQHPLICANLRQRDGSRPLPENITLEENGLSIGIFGVMVPMVTKKMATQAASAFLWDPPIESAQEQVSKLRSNVDCLVALTHIGFKADQHLASACPEIDIILGGHSHTILETPLQVGDTFICQGGSHGKFVGHYEWKGRGKLEGRLVPLGP